MPSLKGNDSRVLLDTQVLVNAYIGEALPKKVIALATHPEVQRLISAASIMEIAVKQSKGKLEMPAEEVRKAVGDLQLTVIPFEPDHAYRLFELPQHHHDPFDRMIIATALAEQIPLVGGDRAFRFYKGLRVIW